MNKAGKLRELFSKPGHLVKIVGAHNGITAKLVEEAGFDAVWASSLEMSASAAVPDMNILTMTDYLALAVQMNEAVSIPIVVDVDQGYGNSNNVIRMVQKFEQAGIGGVIMEDKLFPKQNSLLAGGRQELAPIAEFVGKIMAAKNAQQTKDFMVMARVEALIAGWGHEEAMKRAKAYAAAGADAIMMHSKSSDPEEVLQFVRAWDEDVPIVLVPTNYPTLDEEALKQYPKVKMVIYANHVMRTVVGAVRESLKEIRESGGIKTITPKLIPVKTLFELQGTFEMKAAEKQFLRTGKEPIQGLILAGGKPRESSLSPLIQDTPLAMLDINGKTVLQRQAEIFKSLGINNINVVAGYQPEKIKVEDANIILNEDYESTHILHSIMKAKDTLKEKTVMAYSDIIFEKQIIDRLLKTEGDIVLVVDSSFNQNADRKSKLAQQQVVLVKAEHDPVLGERVVREEKANKVLRIGKKMSPDEAKYEYVGLAMFSQKGIEDFKKAYEEEKAAHSGGEFHEAMSFEKANFFDLLQKMIDKGYSVNALEIQQGWSEINTFEDYKRITSMLK